MSADLREALAKAIKHELDDHPEGLCYLTAFGDVLPVSTIADLAAKAVIEAGLAAHPTEQASDDEEFCPKCFAGMDAVNHDECKDLRPVGERWLAGEVSEDNLLPALILEDREKRAEHELKCAGYWRNGKCTVHPDVSRDPEPVTLNALVSAYVERLAGGSRQVIADNLREFALKIERRQRPENEVRADELENAARDLLGRHNAHGYLLTRAAALRAGGE